jgi:hypothetical protein
MIRRISALGAAVAVVLAMSAIAVSMASADVMTSESAATTTLFGDNDGVTSVLSLDGLEMKCTNDNYIGSISSGASQVTLTFTKSGCLWTAFAGTINPNECSYLLKIKALVTTGTTDIVCPAGHEITVTWPPFGKPKCIIHIPPQSNLGTVTWTNIGAGTTREMTLDLNITGLKFDQTAGTAESLNCATADNTTGTFIGKIRLTGMVSTVHVGVFLS